MILLQLFVDQVGCCCIELSCPLTLQRWDGLRLARPVRFFVDDSPRKPHIYATADRLAGPIGILDISSFIGKVELGSG